jgi:hypothetical protein
MHSYAGFSGPWIENVFIDHFLNSTGNATTLTPAAEAFYPLVPLFGQWTDGRFGGDSPNHAAYKSWFDTGFGGLMRRDVLYAAVTQLDRGEPAAGLRCSAHRNTVVFSSGGWGNVALPLMSRQTEHIAVAYAAGASAWPRPGDFTSIPRSLVFSFVGTIWLGREEMVEAFARAPIPVGLFQAVRAPDWRNVSLGAIFSLTPRGYGRSSFRQYEMLQFGKVVIYVTDEVMWLPYQHSADFPRSGLPGSGGTRPALSVNATQSMNPCDFGAVAGDGAGNTTERQQCSATPLAQVVPSGGAILRGGNTAPDVEGRILNEGGMWGPGGVGFALRYADIPAFACVACEFLQPGSAARWRNVRTLPLHRYGPADPRSEGTQRLCPCSTEKWQEVLRGLETVGSTGVKPLTHDAQATGNATFTGPWLLPADCLVAEMERRIALVRDSFFTMHAAVAHIQAVAAAPLGPAYPSSQAGLLDSDMIRGVSDGAAAEPVANSAWLKCVPKPPSYGEYEQPGVE